MSGNRIPRCTTRGSVVVVMLLEFDRLEFSQNIIFPQLSRISIERKVGGTPVTVGMDSRVQKGERKYCKLKITQKESSKRVVRVLDRTLPAFLPIRHNFHVTRYLT